MGLERRGNGYYFYEKKRIGNRVVSTYSGGGEVARLMHLLDQQRQEETWHQKDAWKRSLEADKRDHDAVDQLIDAFCQEAEALETAIFLINGYHKHSRGWRRKRNGNKVEG
ncbi:MAG: hypothetical protein WBD22_01600, partial [Pyrinomonadaceae bacterium]